MEENKKIPGTRGRSWEVAEQSLEVMTVEVPVLTDAVGSKAKQMTEGSFSLAVGHRKGRTTMGAFSQKE